MKLKQIESLLKKKKTIITTHAEGCQWLSDGSAFYPVSGLPELTKENLFAIFDVPVEKREGYYFQEIIPPELNFDNADPGEQLTGKSDVYIVYEGRCLYPQITSQGLAFIDSKYLRPFYGQEDGFDIYERINAKGHSYFAVKSGFLLLGLILPVKIDYAPLIQMMDRLSAMAKAAMENELTLRKQELYQQGLFSPEQEGGAT